MKLVTSIFSIQTIPMKGITFARFNNKLFMQWKKTKSLTFLLVILFCACSPSTGYFTSCSHTYYLDATAGNDNNQGTSPEEAWKSLNKIQSLNLKAGDKVLLKKGEIFTGELHIKGTGTPEQQIIIDAYGDRGNNPCIVGYDNSAYAVYVYNSSYITIQNLEIINTGKERLPNRTGIKVHLDNYGTAHSILLKGLYIHDVNGSLVKKEGGGSGIYIVNEGKIPSTFDGLTIEDCTIRRCERNAMIWWGYSTRDFWYPNRNVVVKNNLIEEVPGDGIVPIGCDGALIEYNIMRNCTDMLPEGEYAAGIWPWSCDNTLIQYNEVSDHKAPGDAQGYDSDNNCNNTVIQYNYSHDNEGGFLLVCDTGESTMPENVGTNNTIIRGNISINDGNRTRLTKSGYFSPTIHIAGPAKKTMIYNNIIHVNKKKAPEVQRSLICITPSYGDADSTIVRDNLFYVSEISTFHLGTSTNNQFENNYYLGDIQNIPEDKTAKFENETYSNMIKNDLSGFESLKPFLRTANISAGRITTVDNEAIDSFFKK